MLQCLPLNMAGQAPTAVIQAALSRFNEVAASTAAAAEASAELPVFIEAAAGFAGRKPGYFFGTGTFGIGYVPLSSEVRPRICCT